MNITSVIFLLLDAIQEEENILMIDIGKGTMDLTITLDSHFEHFTKKNATSLLRAIKTILKIEDEVEIKKIEKGSVLVTINLTLQEAKDLYSAFKMGGLKSHKVVEVELKRFIEKIEDINIAKKKQNNERHQLIVNLFSIKLNLKDSLAKDIGVVLKDLKSLIAPQSSHYDDIIRLLNRYNRSLTYKNTATIKLDDLEFQFNKITDSIMSLINCIEDIDLKREIFESIH